MKHSKFFLAAILFAGAFSLSASEGTETAAKIVAEKKLPNLVRNGDFSKKSIEGMPPGWIYWKDKGWTGKVEFKEVGVDKSLAAVISGGKINILCDVPIEGGETIYLRFKTKKIGDGKADISIRYKKEGKKWMPRQKFQVSKTIEFSDSDEWTVVELVAKAPANAKFVVPIFGSTGSDKGKVVFDDVECYAIPDSED